jgi:hypothetical protein
MRMRKSLTIAILLIALLAFTASIALADDTLPPTEEPTEPDDSTEQTERLPGQNPVAWFLSQYFAEAEHLVWELDPPEGELDPQGESDPQNDNDMYDYIMELHEDYGFGVLARAFYLYSQVNDAEFELPEGVELPDSFTGSFEDFLAARKGVGWGVLYKEWGLPRNEGSLGWAFKNAEEAEKPGKSSKWAKNPTEPDETGEPDESGGEELTGAGVKPDKPGKPDKPDKPDNAGKKDKKPKDK